MAEVLEKIARKINLVFDLLGESVSVEPSNIVQVPDDGNPNYALNGAAVRVYATRVGEYIVLAYEYGSGVIATKLVK